MWDPHGANWMEEMKWTVSNVKLKYCPESESPSHCFNVVALAGAVYAVAESSHTGGHSYM